MERLPIRIHQRPREAVNDDPGRRILKHKPGMIMVISIGDKPKKKGETGVKKEARDPETGVTEAYNQAQNFPKNRIRRGLRLV